MKNRPDYIPALRYPWLTQWYDVVLGYLFPEKEVKQRLIDQTEVVDGMKILDFGVGTGTLSLLLKRQKQQVEITGLDVDPKALKIAGKKFQAARASIDLIQYDGKQIPFSDGSFDRVMTCLVFHHLLPEQKRQALLQIRRVLKPGGSLHVADWGKPSTALMRGLFYLVQLLDGFATTSSHVRGRLPVFLMEAGFGKVEEKGKRDTAFGTMRFYHCQ
jgi:ubiquinone/menaquinone biosynthesis C-methylase UbiE